MSDMVLEIPYYQPPKKPTLLQFLESEKSVKLKVKYFCMKVWFPNQYPTMCLETEYFRINIDESHPLFDSISAFCQKMIETSQPFAISVNADRDGGFGIMTTSEKGTWNKVGKTGHEFLIDVKKTPKAKF